MRRPKGVLTTETKRQNAKRSDTFSGATALFASPASLFCILFSDKPEKSMPPEAVSLIQAQNPFAQWADRGVRPYTAGSKQRRKRTEALTPVIIHGTAYRFPYVKYLPR